MGTSNRYSPEVGERAVPLVLEHQGEAASQWAAIESIAAKIGCPGETLRHWVRQAERDLVRGTRPSTPTSSYRRGPWKGLEDVEFATLGMGRLVQPPSPARSARLCAASRV